MQTAGSSPLKGEIRRLASGISYASSQLEIVTNNPKMYKKGDLVLVLQGLETNMNAFMRAYTAIAKKIKKARESKSAANPEQF